MRSYPLWTTKFRTYSIDIIGQPGKSAASRPRFSSDTYALWLDDVLNGLSVDHASVVGLSLGGWLAIDYAIRRPERVDAMVAISPAGVGRQKMARIALAFIASKFGVRGRLFARRILDGPSEGNGPMTKLDVKFGALELLLFRNFRPRIERLPVHDDASLGRIKGPMMVVLGGRDGLIDAAMTKRRLESHIPHAQIDYRDRAGHFMPIPTEQIFAFLGANLPLKA